MEKTLTEFKATVTQMSQKKELSPEALEIRRSVLRDRLMQEIKEGEGMRDRYEEGTDKHTRMQAHVDRLWAKWEKACADDE